MRIRTLTFLSFFILGALGVQAQDGLPPKPDGNKCYVKCVTPDEYKDTVVTVLKKPAFKKLEIIPEEYKTETETVVIKEASKKIEYIPAVYKTVYDTIMIKQPFNTLKIDGAKFNPSSETVEIYPAVSRWEMGEPAADCPSPNLNDCRVVCWKEYPPRYSEIPVELKEKDETTVATKVEPKFKIVPRQVIDKPATTKETPIPQKTQVVERLVLVKDQTTKVIDVPAVYEEVTKTVMIKKGGLTVWKEMDCEFTEGVILPIFYATGSAALTQSSKSVIDDKIYALMKKEPMIAVEIDSHTDSRGDDSSNQKLSQSRAQSVVDYLVAKGIKRDRLIAKGWGETRLTNRCKNGVPCSQTEHQANRRTSFKVVSR